MIFDATTADARRAEKSASGDSPPTVIVPSFNGADLLARLLRSLRTQTIPHDVVIVDNGSTDGTATFVAREFPEVTMVSLTTNVGFGRAINRGVNASASDTIVLLNNDVVCEPTFLENLASAIDSESGVVMAAGVLLQASDPMRIDTAGIEFDRTLLAFDYLHGEHVSMLDRGVPDPLGPCAGAAAFDRAAFDSVGGFDENFFAYLEDVDLVARLLIAGGTCRLATTARAVHEHSATLGARSRSKNELIGWGRGYIIGKYRMHTNPRLLSRALVGEAVGAIGKMVVDRNALGIRARIHGWQIGRRGPGLSLDGLPDRVSTVSFSGAVKRRVLRRIR